jgi:hypothetical protein
MHRPVPNWVVRVGNEFSSDRGEGPTVRGSAPAPGGIAASGREPCDLAPHHGALTRRKVVGAGFEPAKAEPTGLQPVPFDRSGTPPATAAV